MHLADPTLIHHLQLAYSAERAAALAYRGHAASLRNPAERADIHRIEADEWHHRAVVGRLMRRYHIPVSGWLEARYLTIGKLIGASCHLIGRFMPFFFAGRLESGNVCAYIRMARQFRELGITGHEGVLVTMGLKEKEHEDYFAAKVDGSPWLPLFERLFTWGPERSGNDVAPVGLTTAIAAARHWCGGRPETRTTT